MGLKQSAVQNLKRGIDDVEEVLIDRRCKFLTVEAIESGQKHQNSTLRK
jgi:hypothetical protein